jgi:hypothetical protein
MHGSTHTLGWPAADATGTWPRRGTAIDLRRKTPDPGRPAPELAREAERCARRPRRPRFVGESALFALTLAAMGGLELAAALLVA